MVPSFGMKYVPADKDGRVHIYAGEKQIFEHVKSDGRHRVVFGRHSHDVASFLRYHVNPASCLSPFLQHLVTLYIMFKPYFERLLKPIDP